MVPLARTFPLPARKVRQAWLSPEFARLYPELPAGCWVTAASAAAVIAGAVVARARPWPANTSRVLPDAHFRFRGGEGRGPHLEVRTRATDP